MICYLSFTLTAFLLAISAFFAFKYFSEKKLSSCSGFVNSIKISPVGLKTSGAKYYSIKITYRYILEGEVYEGNRVSLLKKDIFTEKDLLPLRKLKDGDDVTIYFDTNNRNRSCIILDGRRLLHILADPEH